MTWFSKTFGICAALMLLGFTLEVFGYTITMCRKRCKNETDDNLCAQKMFKLDNGGKAPDNVWLRNECERKCVMYGEYVRVNMPECKGQNHSTYMCSRARIHPELFKECKRNQTLINERKNNTS